MTAERFPFAFDRRFAPLLAVLGVRHATSHVDVDDERFAARFGRLRLETPMSNIRDVRITRDYRWFTAIGARGSFVDRGATFGTNAAAGVCVCFHEPVPALLGQRFPHPGLTVTVADPEGLVASLERRLRG